MKLPFTFEPVASPVGPGYMAEVSAVIVGMGFKRRPRRSSHSTTTSPAIARTSASLA